MPTYEYECNKCGHRFERFQMMTDKPLQRCPKCRGKIRRLISGGAGIIFKGHGFYVTDYRTESYKAGEKKDKPADKPAEKPDKKPAKKDTD